jgi:quinol monooxygenase YgiN
MDRPPSKYERGPRDITLENDRMIRVLATIELAEGRRGDFLLEFAKIVPLVLEEQGCLEYGPMVDVPTSIGAQAGIRENAVTVVEKWETVDALEAHLVTPHMIEYRKKVKEMVTGTELRILKPA